MHKAEHTAANGGFELLDQLLPDTPAQAQQIQAARLALQDRFKDSVHMMLKSLGQAPEPLPARALPGPITTASCGHMAEIGNIFLYRRLIKAMHGQIACSILKGDYGVAAQLMIEKEMAPLLARQLEELPEALDELQHYLETHPVIHSANDPFLPSWAR